MLRATILLESCSQRTQCRREAEIRENPQTPPADAAASAARRRPRPLRHRHPAASCSTTRACRNAELAARIGLSAAPTWRRVKWLEQQGYITGYRAEIDRRKIGLGVLAFVRVDAERNTGRPRARSRMRSAACPR